MIRLNNGIKKHRGKALNEFPNPTLLLWKETYCKIRYFHYTKKWGYVKGAKYERIIKNRIK
ncbi:hypothetical protein EF514_05990 [Anaerosphaera multitolerans]|uniref:Uncharacterized protein n=1 Tax=Anaerosphaera multitolerans TaxID=2487351 RepID=A0A437S6L8_9FIRM|nr:hypothetical protein EF514_05990 [Anaerosphaera multitolerans]